MNIDQMQKVNRLAKELLAHGIAQTSQDAVVKAEEMVYGRETVSAIAVQKTAEKENQEIRELHSSLRQLHSDFSRFSAELSSLKAEHEKLKSEFIGYRQRNFTPSQPAKKSPALDSPKQQPQDDDPLHGISPDDVAIDKVFYFGKNES